MTTNTPYSGPVNPSTGAPWQVGAGQGQFVDPNAAAVNAPLDLSFSGLAQGGANMFGFGTPAPDQALTGIPGFFVNQGAGEFGQALQGAGTAFNAYTAYQNLGQQEESLEFQKLAYLLDSERQAKQIRIAGEDQAQRRLGNLSPKDRNEALQTGEVLSVDDASNRHDLTNRGVVRDAANRIKQDYNLSFPALKQGQGR